MTIPRKQQHVVPKRCQKCLTQGHWSYECKKPYKVRVRPSRTQILKNYMKTVKNDGNSSKTVIRTKIVKKKSTKSKRDSSPYSTDSDSSSSSSSSSDSDSDSSSSSSSLSDSDDSTSSSSSSTDSD